MPPQEPSPQPVQPTMHNPLSVMQPGEQTLFELKRHPIGILTIYIMTAIVLAALGVVVFAVAPGIINSADSGQVKTIGGLLFLIFALLCLAFNFIATIIYWGNKWILTDDSITQVSQTGLFKKQSSQLGLESLEDVTAEKNGILSQVFDYGVLKAETAGHRSKFVFNFCPNPNYYAKQILEAHEKENLERLKLGVREDEPRQNPDPMQPTRGATFSDNPTNPSSNNNPYQ